MELIARFGGMVSVGQQAFVGFGPHALFAGVILWGWGPVPAILLGGIAAFLLAIPMAFLAFRLQGAYFAIGTWVGVATIAELFGCAKLRPAMCWPIGWRRDWQLTRWLRSMPSCAPATGWR